jgi:LmbE family N-acetylglucosaminyl deacetylase
MAGLYSELSPRPGRELPVPSRALAIGAHPDDVEFGAGGTLARWADAGAHVGIVVVTDGSKGTWDPDADPRALAAARRREAEHGAAVLGAAVVDFMDAVDGELEPAPELRAGVAGRIRRFEPDVVLTHDPWQRYQLHPDHRAAGWIVVDAVVAARDPMFYPDQLTGGTRPHRPSALLLWSADEPDHWEDVSGWLERKVEALLCHTTQGRTTMGDAQRGGSARDAFAAEIERWAAREGGPAGLAAAESFRMLEP